MNRSTELADRVTNPSLISRIFLALVLTLSATLAVAQPLRPTPSSSMVELRGEVIAFDFSSPVTRIVFDVAGSSGSSSAWTAETLSAVELRRFGWTSGSLTPGEYIVVRGQLLDSSSGRITLTEVERANGSRLSPGDNSKLLSLNSGHYSLVPGRSYLRLSFDHQGFSTASFWFTQMQAGLNLNADFTPTGLQVDLIAEDLQSGSAELTRLLKSSTFFASANYPVISYTSEGFTRLADNRYRIDGTLTVRGTARPLQLIAVINKAGVHPLTGNPGFGVSARGTLDRSNWNMTQFAPEVGLDVNIEIEAEFELGFAPVR